MIPEERLKEIKAILYEKENISINKLCEKLFCSRSTIRRDIIELENAGIVRRIHGGVSLVKSNNIELSEVVRSSENRDKKEKIAGLAQQFLKDDITIFMDSSSTVRQLCPYLKKFRNITVITNGIATALELTGYTNIKVYLCGGLLKSKSTSIIGESSSDFLKDFYADLSFISCKSMDSNGVYEADSEQGLVKRHMIKNAKYRVLLCDSSKLQINSVFNMCELGAIDCVITDMDIIGDLKENLIKSGVRMLYYK